MAKLIFPNMYLEIDLLKVIVANYDCIGRVVRTHSSQEMVLVTKEEIDEVFKLNKWSNDMVENDEKKVREEYEKVRPTLKVLMLVHFLISRGKGKGRIILGPSDKEPFPIK